MNKSFFLIIETLSRVLLTLLFNILRGNLNVGIVILSRDKKIYKIFVAYHRYSMSMIKKSHLRIFLKKLKSKSTDSKNVSIKFNIIALFRVKI